MVVLDQFYQIAEQDTSRVSSFWKVLHILACTVSAICGFLTAFTFGRVLDNFTYNCVLNAQIVFDNSSFLNISHGGRIVPKRALDLTATIWGPAEDCNFAQFTPLFIMISALIWGAYFIVIAKGGAGHVTDLLGKPWLIVYPCLIFTTILFITYIISTLKLKHGVEAFCNQFQPEFNNTGCVPEINIYTEQFHDREHSHVLFYEFYPNILVAIVSSDIGLWSWVVQLILCVTRVCCVADLDLQLVTIVSKEDVCYIFRIFTQLKSCLL
jgi:hypothetical protein